VAHNTYAPSPRITNNSPESEMVVNLVDTHTYAEPETTEITFATWPKPAKIGTNDLFNVMDYGAVGTGGPDDTQAFIDALAAAGANGGGTVYIPAGIYDIHQRLTIPSGVELRGSHGGSINPKGSRCILMLYGDMGQPGNPGYITLNANSGVNGFAIFRPEQEKQLALPFMDAPPVVQSAGSNCWAANMLLCNTVKGIDFNVGDGHKVVGWLYAGTFWAANEEGYTLKIRSDVNLSEVENLQLKPDSWQEMRSADWAGLAVANGMDAASALAQEEWVKNIAPSGDSTIPIANSGTGVITHGDGEFKFIAQFINRSMKSYIINGDPKIRIFMGGGEGPADGVFVYSTSGELDMEEINMTYHNDGIAGQYWIGPGGVAKVFNAKTYLSSGSHSVRHMNGPGTLILQQDYRDDDLSDGYCKANHGTTIIEGCFFKGAQNPRVNTDGCGTALITGVTTKQDNGFYDNDVSALTMGTLNKGPTWLTGGPTNTPCGQPKAPVGLVADVEGTVVTLDWFDNTDFGLAGYSVYRSTNSGSYGSALATNLLSSEYTDSTVSYNITYYYVVTASDSDGGESLASDEVSVRPDGSPPEPNPAGFASAPYADGSTAISMTATTATDASGIVEYRFTETSGGPGANSSGWQSSASYTDHGLNPNTQYSYTVTYRDALGNTGNPSAAVRAYTYKGIEIANAGFETPIDNSSHEFRPTNAVWTFTGNAGIQRNGSAFNAENAPEGQQTLLLKTISSITQSIPIDAGEYEIVFWMARRPNYQLQTVEVLFDGASLGTYKTTDPTFNEKKTAPFTVPSSGTYVLEFRGLGKTDENGDPLDVTAFIDDIRIQSTEPPIAANFDQWALNYGGTDLIGSSINDYDGDGQVNLAEYALGGNPTNELDHGENPTMDTADGGMWYIHPQRAHDPELIYTVQVSTNLISGGWTNDYVTAVGTNVTGETLNYVTNQVPDVEPKLYIRLKVGSE